MTQDCLDSHSTAGVSRRLPKGINITGTGGKPAPAIEGIPWGYLFIHNKTAQVFEREMDSYNENNPQSAHACFIHRSFTDRCKGLPASISDRVMQPFMTVLKDNPERVTFLRDPFEKFAREHVKLRVLTGLFAGCEGYIVRIDRDRQLVFDFGGYAVAIRGVHKEDFEEVEE